MARDAFGRETRQVVRVRRDATAPVLAWSAPEDAVAAGTVTVRGTVADASACEVRVNGLAAQVVEGRWAAQVVVDARQPLPVTVTARDAAGNVSPPLTRTLRSR